MSNSIQASHLFFREKPLRIHNLNKQGNKNKTLALKYATLVLY